MWLSSIAARPAVVPRLGKQVIERGRDVELDYLVKEREGGLSFARLAPFHFVAAAFRYGANVFAIAVLPFVLIALARSGRSGRPAASPALVAAAFLLAFGASQYAVVLADGLQELSKHLIGGNFALALGLPLLLASREPRL